MRLITQKQLCSIARNDLAVFCSLVRHGFQSPRHIQAMISVWEKVERGEIDRVVLNKPPRHGGTTVNSELGPSWYLGKHPDRNVAVVLYGSDLASEVGRRFMQIVTSPIYAQIFPEARLCADVGSSQHLEFQKGGHSYFLSRNESFTGRGASVIVGDDLLKDGAEAASPNIRAQIHEWFSRVALTRLTPTGAVILSSTRWHEDDLTGFVLRQETDRPWTKINLTAVATENDFLGRQPGEALWPERFDEKYLARRRAEMGSKAFVALYQGAPAEATGNIFKREWMRSYSESEVRN